MPKEYSNYWWSSTHGVIEIQFTSKQIEEAYADTKDANIVEWLEFYKTIKDPYETIDSVLAGCGLDRGETDTDERQLGYLLQMAVSELRDELFMLGELEA